ncbi:MAG: hypothetical protein MUF01_00735 [Bryobacterales bacterium]|jgi:hypothetical protein|nr:hypothetical protein [Bryobacterales bacterium]
MKLRVHGNTVRLRLRKSEIDRFANEGILEEGLRIGAGDLGYRLERFDGDEVQADFDSGVLRIYVPSAVAADWVHSEEVGIYATTPTVEVILEKEFRRTSQKTEFDADLYPNPRAGKHLQQIEG